MEATTRALIAWAAGLVLLGVAVAVNLPSVLAAAFGVLGVALMGFYAFRVIRSGALGVRHLDPTQGIDGWLGHSDVPAGHHGHHDGGAFGGGDFGGGGGHGGH